VLGLAEGAVMGGFITLCTGGLAIWALPICMGIMAAKRGRDEYFLYREQFFKEPKKVSKLNLFTNAVVGASVAASVAAAICFKIGAILAPLTLGISLFVGGVIGAAIAWGESYLQSQKKDYQNYTSKKNIGKLVLSYVVSGLMIALSSMKHGLGIGISLIIMPILTRYAGFRKAFDDYESLKVKNDHYALLGAGIGFGVGIALALFTGGLSIPVCLIIGSVVGAVLSELSALYFTDKLATKIKQKRDNALQASYGTTYVNDFKKSAQSSLSSDRLLIYKGKGKSNSGLVANSFLQSSRKDDSYVEISDNNNNLLPTSNEFKP